MSEILALFFQILLLAVLVSPICILFIPALYDEVKYLIRNSYLDWKFGPIEPLNFPPLPALIIKCYDEEQTE